MTRVIAPWLLLYLTACAQADARCIDNFLGEQSAWESLHYEGPVPLLTSQYSNRGHFSPIENLMVVDGQLLIGTWGSEPMQSRVEPQGDQMRIHPTFLTRVGADSELSHVASEAADFARSDRKYFLQLVGGCRRPTQLVVRIVDGDGVQIGSVELSPSN